MTTLPDTHCHLGHIDRDPSLVLSEAAAAGVGPVIDIAMGLAEAQVSVARAAGTEGLYAAVGIHPNDLHAFEADPDGTMRSLQAFAEEPSVVGVGETGIDRYRDRHPLGLQEDAFRAHIELAERLDRTLVIHCRDAHDDVLRILDDAGAPSRTVMHCFSGDVAFARACAERSFYCSFAGNLTYKRNDTLREAARHVPDDRLLVETDAPFLAPVPFRGKPNAPALVTHTARVLADTRSVAEDELLQMLHVNTRRAFVIA